MSQATLIKKYNALDSSSKGMLQTLALLDVPLRRTDMGRLVKDAGATDAKGKKITQKAVSQSIDKLLKAEMLVSPWHGNYDINPEIQDWAIQDSIRTGAFSELCAGVEKQISDRYYYYSSGNGVERQLRIAFYKGDVEQVRSLLGRRNLADYVRVLNPFDRRLFDNLNPASEIVLDRSGAVGDLQTRRESGSGPGGGVRRLDGERRLAGEPASGGEPGPGPRAGRHSGD